MFNNEYDRYESMTDDTKIRIIGSLITLAIVFGGALFMVCIA